MYGAYSESADIMVQRVLRGTLARGGRVGGVSAEDGG